jgi:hypothetical protein
LEQYFDSNGNAVSQMQHSAEKCGGWKLMSFQAFSGACTRLGVDGETAVAAPSVDVVRQAFSWNKTGTLGISMLYVDNGQGRAAARPASV